VVDARGMAESLLLRKGTLSRDEPYMPASQPR
jgi:hypothetical protein